MYSEAKKHFLPSATQQPFWIELTGTSYCDYSYKISRTLQASNVYVIEYIISGTGTIAMNSREYHPCAGDFYILQPGNAHEYQSSANNPWTKVFANVYGPLCREVVDIYGLTNTVLVKNCDVKKQFQDFINIANSSNLKESLIMSLCAAKFVEIIATAATYTNTNHITDNKEVNQICDFLNANTHRIVNISELSNLIYRSSDYTIKLFKRILGFTPYDYQIQQKIDVCKSRLCTSNDPIAHIASDLGYEDQQHFSKLFKSRSGVSPRQYRDLFFASEKIDEAENLLI